MCPICIGTMIVNGLMWIAGSLGFVKFAAYVRNYYYQTTGKKCKKCRDKECGKSPQ
jgi:hypothetical protein